MWSVWVVLLLVVVAEDQEDASSLVQGVLAVVVPAATLAAWLWGWGVGWLRRPERTLRSDHASMGVGRSPGRYAVSSSVERRRARRPQPRQHSNTDQQISLRNR